MKTRRVGAVLFALVFLLVSCRDPVAPSVPLQDLRSAPLAIEISGRSFTLETFVWRDFMPGMYPAGLGSLLNTVVFLTAVDGQAFPADVDADRIWVLKGDEVWEEVLSDGARPRDSVHIYQLERRADGGPRWDVGAEVEVVVRVTVAGGSPLLLRATKQIIGRTV